MSRFTREHSAFLRRIRKLEEQQTDDYWQAYVHYIKTKELPSNTRLKEQFEFEQRNIMAMLNTCPQLKPKED
jgi:U3 small nucleolar ribonucleoprotein component